MGDYIDTVAHLKKKLDKGVSFEKTLHILHKLQKIPITIELLSATGIGKTIRQLSKQYNDNDIGKTAKILCMEWKSMVKEQQQIEQDVEREQINSQSIINSNQSDDEVNDNVSEKIKYEQSSDISKESRKHKKHKSNKKRHHDDDEDERVSKKHSKSSKKTHNSKREKDSDDGHSFGTHLTMNDKHSKNHVKSETNSLGNNSYSERSYMVNGDSFEHAKVQSKKELRYNSNSIEVSCPSALESKDKLKSMDKSEILSCLPVPNYKPLPNKELVDVRIEANKRKTLQLAKDDLSVGVQSKKRRTAVFAGHSRVSKYTHVHRLEDLCLRVLMDNIDKIHYVGDAPYYMLKPVLQRCSTKQLAKLEKLNPHLAEDTDELWKEFCKKEFKDKEPNSDDEESWRELYERSLYERDERLKNIAKNISLKQQKALPVRQTQRAYTETNEKPKPPKEVRRKQEKLANSSLSSSTGGCVKLAAERPKVAPLMRKVLMMQKKSFRR